MDKVCPFVQIFSYFLQNKKCAGEAMRQRTKNAQLRLLLHKYSHIQDKSVCEKRACIFTNGKTQT